METEYSKLDTMLKKHGIDSAKIACGAFCDEGWVDLIDKLIEDLIALGWNKHIDQIKEKFGGLRFYVGDTSRAPNGRFISYKKINLLISKAESESFKICEKCGKSGQPRGGGWIKTLCEGHYRMNK